jgi:hypothetical protein
MIFGWYCAVGVIVWYVMMYIEALIPAETPIGILAHASAPFHCFMSYMRSERSEILSRSFVYFFLWPITLLLGIGVIVIVLFMRECDRV